MREMLTLNATDVRKDWSMVIDSVVREKPKFIRRTRDYMMLADLAFLKLLLEPYTFTAKKFLEDDGTITLELNEIDLVENGFNMVILLKKGINIQEINYNLVLADIKQIFNQAKIIKEE